MASAMFDDFGGEGAADLENLATEDNNRKT